MRPLRPGVFFGTPEFAAVSLRACIDAGRSPQLVITQPDRPAGRRRRLTASAVKRLALDCGIAVEQPQHLSELSIKARRVLAASDCALVVAYGGLLPVDLLGSPTHGCLNLHASLLPRWRGASPVQHAILAGDKQTGVSVMQMDQGLDTGAVLASSSCLVAEHTAASLGDLLAQMGARLLLDTLDRYHDLKAVPQLDKGITYAAKIGKEDARIDWQKPADRIAREVRAFYPAPVSWSVLYPSGSKDGEEPLRVRIWQARAETASLDTSARAGTLVAVKGGCLRVACGQGELVVEQIQLPGAQVMQVAVILRSHSALFQCGGYFE